MENQINKSMKKSNFKLVLFWATLSIALLVLITATLIKRMEVNQENPDATNEPNTPIVTNPNSKLPSQVLNLTNWKLTLPTNTSGKTTEIEQPQLANFELKPWFSVNPEGNGVVFRAAVNGITTSGSDYPRSELREMWDAKKKADWSSDQGTHTMIIDQAVLAVPKNKPDVVIGQIHDENKDIIVIRLDYPTLHIRVDGKDVYTLDSNYTLGKRFNIKFKVNNNQTSVYYNNDNTPVYTMNKDYSNAYFKAGVYTQSNCKKEEDESFCNDTNYAESVIYKLEVTHQ